MAKVYELTQWFVRDDTEHSWVIDQQDDGTAKVTIPDGSQSSIECLLDVNGFRLIAEKFAGIFSVEPLAFNRIECSQEVRGLLPLFLVPGEAAGEKLDESELIDKRLIQHYSAMDDCGGPFDWLLDVNGEPWGSRDDVVFLPLKSRSDLIRGWALLSADEMASRTWENRPIDYQIGAWSTTVGVEWFFFSDDFEMTRAFEITDPATHVLDWAQWDLDGMGVRGVANGSLFNAFAEAMLNPGSNGEFPGLAVFRQESEAADPLLQGTKVDTNFDPHSSFEVSLAVPSPNSRLGRELVKRLKRDYPDSPYFQLDDGSDLPLAEEEAPPPLDVQGRLEAIRALMRSGSILLAEDALAQLRAVAVGAPAASQALLLECLADLRALEGRDLDARVLRARAADLAAG